MTTIFTDIIATLPIVLALYKSILRLKTDSFRARHKGCVAVPMAYGPDSELLLTLVAEATLTGDLDVSTLDIYALPPLPEGLRMLDVSETQLYKLPPLPSTLVHLMACETDIYELPVLPDGLEVLMLYDSPIQALDYTLPSKLRVLNVSSTALADLPSLPEGLEVLCCADTMVSQLPWLPDSLHTLECYDTHLLLRQVPGESMADFIQRWRDEETKERTSAKMRVLKEGISVLGC